MMIAIKLDTNDIFFGRSGLFIACPNRIDPSPTIPAVKLIVAIVPTQYATKKLIADFQELIANAGAILGAPSSDSPWRIPLMKIAFKAFFVSEL